MLRKFHPVSDKESAKIYLDHLRRFYPSLIIPRARGEQAVLDAVPEHHRGYMINSSREGEPARICIPVALN